jgi:hypothetical protein
VNVLGAKTVSRSFSIGDLNTSGQKRTQKWSAGLGSVGVFPYLEDGEIVWHYKDPAIFLAPEFVGQYKEGIVTNDHPWFFADSNRGVIGLTLNPSVEDQLIIGDVVFFDPDSLIQIHNGELTELSPGVLADLEIYDREIAGVRVKYAQKHPRLDHTALVAKGRQGEAVSLKEIRDACNCSAVSYELDTVKKPLIVLHTETSMAEDKTETHEEQLTQLGILVAEKATLTEQNASLTSANEALTQELSDLRNNQISDEAITAKAKQLAMNAQTVLNSANRAGIKADLASAMENPTGILRQIADSFGSDLQVADADLPAFVRGVEIAQAVAPKPPTAPTTVTEEIADSFPGIGSQATSPIEEAFKNIKPATSNVLAALGQADRGLFAKEVK